jgi:hypothetical protein
MTNNELIENMRVALGKAIRELHKCAIERPIGDAERIRQINAVAAECMAGKRELI